MGNAVGANGLVISICKKEHEDYYYIINRLSTLKSLEQIILKRKNTNLDYKAIKEEERQLLKRLRGWWIEMMNKYGFCPVGGKSLHVDPLKYEIYEK